MFILFDSRCVGGAAHWWHQLRGIRADRQQGTTLRWRRITRHGGVAAASFFALHANNKAAASLMRRRGRAAYQARWYQDGRQISLHEDGLNKTCVSSISAFYLFSLFSAGKIEQIGRR